MIALAVEWAALPALTVAALVMVGIWFALEAI